VTNARAKASRPTGLTGAAGEYLVAAELSLQGWLATVTIKNAPGTDVLAQSLKTGVLVAVQTKTASSGSFPLGVKCEIPTSASNQWYVFVRLYRESARPSFFVVPHNVIAGAVYAAHREWLSQLDRVGRPHRDSDMRNVAQRSLAPYEGRWDFLDSPSDRAPLLLDPLYTQLVKKWGLPPGHPGWPST
jgi:hypothetical protein